MTSITRRPALPPEPEMPATVRSLYRSSVKIGDDFRTLECEITVPAGASDEQIREAQDTARRMRQAQADDTEREIEAMREDAQLSGGRSSRFVIRDPESPASAKQRNAIDRLALSKGWDSTRLVSFCELAGYPLLTLTKGSASWLIDALNGAPALPSSPATFGPMEAPLPFEPAPNGAAYGAAVGGEVPTNPTPADDIPF